MKVFLLIRYDESGISQYEEILAIFSSREVAAKERRRRKRRSRYVHDAFCVEVWDVDAHLTKE